MNKQVGLHEDFSRSAEVKLGSERAFGIVFAVVFVLVAAMPIFNGEAPRWWAAFVALAFLLLAFAAPQVLKPLNLLWLRFGMLLHKVMNPLIMALLFFLTVTPIALLMRLAGKDPLRLKFDPQAKSYWIERNPPGPEPESMRRQF